ncbi:MAG: glucose 1-dehydrogenase [Myxococcota bacterium]
MSSGPGIFDLRDRVVIVTGASSGLGVQFAESLAAAGAKLVLAARRKGRLEELANRLAGLDAQPADVLVHPCDVTREEEVDRLVEACLARYGRVDVLVNNAGITEIVPAETHPVDRFRAVVDVNLLGVFLCAQRVGRSMLEAGKGSIVNVASVLGLVGTGQVPQAAYAASKGAVVNLTRELGAQWARRGVRVNCLAPGWFETEMTAEMFSDERSRKWMRTRTPMGRPGRPGELAGALYLLASDASSFMTGHTLTVDGGWTIV